MLEKKQLLERLGGLSWGAILPASRNFIRHFFQHLSRDILTYMNKEPGGFGWLNIIQSRFESNCKDVTSATGQRNVHRWKIQLAWSKWLFWFWYKMSSEPVIWQGICWAMVIGSVWAPYKGHSTYMKIEDLRVLGDCRSADQNLHPPVIWRAICWALVIGSVWAPHFPPFQFNVLAIHAIENWELSRLLY